MEIEGCDIEIMFFSLFLKGEVFWGYSWKERDFYLVVFLGLWEKIDLWGYCLVFVML